MLATLTPTLAQDPTIARDAQGVIELYIAHRPDNHSLCAPLPTQLVLVAEWYGMRFDEVLFAQKLTNTLARCAELHVLVGMLEHLRCSPANSIVCYERARGIYQSAGGQLTAGYAWTLARLLNLYETEGNIGEARRIIEELLLRTVRFENAGLIVRAIQGSVKEEDYGNWQHALHAGEWAATRRALNIHA